MEIISKEKLLEQVAGGDADEGRAECEHKVLDTYLGCVRYAQNNYEGIERAEAVRQCMVRRDSDLAKCRE